MRVKFAKRTGFCFGVRRAVAMAEAALGKGEPIYSLGSVIHNRQVVQALSDRGLKVVNAVKDIKKGTCIISSHGISPHVSGEITARGIKMIDTTCPFVRNAQRIAKAMSAASYNIIIVGDVNHPEVKALVDFVHGKATVVKGEDDARHLKLKKGGKFVVLSQTTQSMDNFLGVVRVVAEKKPGELRVFNTICKDAEERQEAARRLAGSVDAMLVVGGRNSANTKRLFEVCAKVLSNSHLVETEEDLRKRWFEQTRSIGITSGASTPDWIIKKVIDKIQTKGRTGDPAKRRRVY